MIKNIIFDFGDIFINLDKEAIYVEFKKLGLKEATQDLVDVYHQYEKGLISTEAFVAFYVNKFPFLKPQEVVDAWNSILKDIPKRRLKFVKDLAASGEYRLFLLSNTNDLHISWIQNDWGMAQYSEFKACFEQFYLSHEIHFRKPDANIYEFVLEQNNLVADETLFVDDLKENTDAANTLGIHTWNLIPGEEDVVNLLTRPEFNL